MLRDREPSGRTKRGTQKLCSADYLLPGEMEMIDVGELAITKGRHGGLCFFLMPCRR